MNGARVPCAFSKQVGVVSMPLLSHCWPGLHVINLSPCGSSSPPTEDHPTKFEFENGIVGNAIPPTYIPACEKGFREAVNAGALIGHPVEVRCPC
jgi:translation elongation factor EF-G